MVPGGKETEWFVLTSGSIFLDGGNMPVSRSEVLNLVNEFPEEIDVEELIYRLYLREKLAAAEEDIAAGRTLSTEELKAQAALWQG